MKMRTLRKIRALAPRMLRRRDFDLSDATVEADPGPAPEAVFDRLTGPFDHRRGYSNGPGTADEET